MRKCARAWCRDVRARAKFDFRTSAATRDLLAVAKKVDLRLSRGVNTNLSPIYGNCGRRRNLNRECGRKTSWGDAAPLNLLLGYLIMLERRWFYSWRKKGSARGDIEFSATINFKWIAGNTCCKLSCFTSAASFCIHMKLYDKCTKLNKFKSFILQGLGAIKNTHISKALHFFFLLRSQNHNHRWLRSKILTGFQEKNYLTLHEK